jgi:hypothetical protein
MPPAAPPPAPDELSALLRLLDDETPEVREQVGARLALLSGDLSEWLAARPEALGKRELALLAEMLRPGRRATLAREWVVPSGGAAALAEDWETFEAMLRALSDFLHDGVTLRQPLSDALDLLAEEAGEAGVMDEEDLRAHLFESGRMRSNAADYGDPRNSDLAWCIAEGCSNPIGLCLIFILVARRMDLEVEGVNYPGHFLCRIHHDGIPWIVDCHDCGRKHAQDVLLAAGSGLSVPQRRLLQATAGPGAMLVRVMNNLIAGLERDGRDEDAALVRRLKATLGG